MTTLITGIAGFIGSHLARNLLIRGDKILGIDNISDYYDVNLKYDRLNSLKSYKNFIFEKIDISNYSDLEKIIKNYKTNKSLYIGEKVTMTEHMIQTAMLAEENQSPTSLICACLLHDYGHFIIKDPDQLVSKSRTANMKI